MITFMFWSGVALWSAIGLLVIWLLVEAAWGFVCAASFLRWRVRLMLRDKSLHRAKWSALPRDFLGSWWDFIGYRNDGSTTTTAQRCGSVWRGVGDYTITKNRPEAAK